MGMRFLVTDPGALRHLVRQTYNGRSHILLDLVEWMP